MAVEITRMELSAQGLRASGFGLRRRRRMTRRRRGRCWRSRWFWIGRVSGPPPRRAGRTGRRCGEEDQASVQWTVAPTNAHRCNAEGLEGLSNRRSAGSSPLPGVEQKAELAREAGMARRPCACRKPSPSCCVRPLRLRNSLPSRLSGPVCAQTASPSPSSRSTRRSWSDVATPGTSSPTPSRPSDPSQPAIAPMRSKVKAVGIKDGSRSMPRCSSRSIIAWARSSALMP